MPSPASADIRCSTVPTFVPALLQPGAHARVAHRIGIGRKGQGGSRSTRWKTMPVSGAAGRRVRVILRPPCKPTPVAVTTDFRVRRRIMVFSSSMRDFNMHPGSPMAIAPMHPGYCASGCCAPDASRNVEPHGPEATARVGFRFSRAAAATGRRSVRLAAQEGRNVVGAHCLVLIASTVVRRPLRITAGTSRLVTSTAPTHGGRRCRCPAPPASPAGARARRAESGGHHGDADAVFHGVVEHGAVLDEGFGRAKACTVFTASRTSDIFSDLLAVMLISTQRAPESSGALERRRHRGLLGGDACAVHAGGPAEPIIARPISAIAVRTSWKSTLTRLAR